MKVAFISLKKYLVCKIPLNISMTENENNRFIVKMMSLDDIENDHWLKKDKKSLSKMIKLGHLGVVVFDKARQIVAARGFIAINGKRPDHIPKVPKNSTWLHYQAVRDEFQGQGLQKDLIMFSIKLIRKIDDKIDIYIDTDENNIPSRINQKKLGLVEDGIYTVLKIGTQRMPFGFIQFGFWNKNRKHSALLTGESSASGGHHRHLHVHEETTHEHRHNHSDTHHNHAHYYEIDCEHYHKHTHQKIEHTHRHIPDMHHTHSHYDL